MVISRRQFLTYAGGVTAACALPGCENPEPVADSPPRRTLGKTGLSLTLIGFGAQRVSDPSVVAYALDKGINHIDTSLEYDCSVVESALKGGRDGVHLMVATRALGHHLGQRQAADQEFLVYLRKTFPRTIESMLRRLHTGVIDVFLLKQISRPELIETDWILESLANWRREGKVRCCGVTSHENEAEILRAVANSDVFQVAIVPFNYKSPPEIAIEIEKAVRKGTGVIAMKTQSPNFRDPEGIIGDAEDHRQALKWVLSKEFVAAAIPGMTTNEQVDLNLRAINGLA